MRRMTVQLVLGVFLLTFLGISNLEGQTGPSATVTSLADGGDGSLRAVLENASAGTLVTFEVQGTIHLESPIFVGTRAVTVEGPAGGGVVLDGGMKTQLLRVVQGPPATQVVLRRLRLRQGFVLDADGGAIANEGNLALESCWVEGSMALRSLSGSRGGNGGGIHNLGHLRLTASSLTNNAAASLSPASGSGNGGGLSNGVDVTRGLRGSAELADTTFAGNVAFSFPPPAASETRDLHTQRRGLGGGIYNDSAPGAASSDERRDGEMASILLSHVTVARNTAGGGGGLCNRIDYFTGGEELEKGAGVARVYDSVFAENSSTAGDFCPPDSLGPMWSDSSLVRDGSIVFGDRNLVEREAGLGELKGYGNRPPVLTPLLESLLIGYGSVPATDSPDQNGVLRKAGAPSDLGAVQSPVEVVALEPGSPVSLYARDGSQVRVSLTGSGKGTLSFYPLGKLFFVGLTGSARDTRLSVGQGDGFVLAGLQADGPVGSVIAPGVVFRGPIEIAGPCGEIEGGALSNDWSGRVAVTLKAESPGVILRFGKVDGLTLDVDGPIDRFEAEEVTSSSAAPAYVRASGIGHLLVSGAMEQTRIETAGDIGEIRAAGLFATRILAGMARDLVGMPYRSTDFVAQARIGTISVTGAMLPGSAATVTDSVIAAAIIGEASLGNVAKTSVLPASGLGAQKVSLARYSVGSVSDGWTAQVYQDLSGPAASVQAGDFHIALFSPPGKDPGAGGPALKWSFAVLDDTRGGTIIDGAPSGTAYWNLGPLTADAYAQGASLVLIPGDLVSGYLRPDLMYVDLQYRSFYKSTGLVHGPGHEGDLRVFRRPDDTFVKWAPYTTGSTLQVVKGNHESYFWIADTREKWMKYFGKYVANASSYAPLVKFVSTGAEKNSDGLDSRGMTFAFEFQNAFFVLVDQYDARRDVDFNDGTVPGFFCLSDNTWKEPSGEISKNKNWLDGMLTYYDSNATRLQHAWAFGHSPLYPTGDTKYQTGGENGQGPQRDQFVSLLSKHDVEIFFCGHDHLWDHSVVKNTKAAKGYENLDGLHQILVGVGGADLDRDKKFTPPFTDPRFVAGCDYTPITTEIGPETFHKHENARMGYVLVTVDGTEVTVRRVAYDIVHFDYDKLKAKNPAFDSVWKYGTKKKSAPISGESVPRHRLPDLDPVRLVGGGAEAPVPVGPYSW